MFIDIIHIAFLCIVIGGASIPLSFAINSNPFVVWFGNSLGSLISAGFVIYFGNRISNAKFKQKVSKYRIGRRLTRSFDEHDDSKKVLKATGFINKHGLKLFSLVCPIFPGVLVSTILVYALALDKRTYIPWMLAGVALVSGGYVFSYWWVFINR